MQNTQTEGVENGGVTDCVIEDVNKEEGIAVPPKDCSIGRLNLDKIQSYLLMPKLTKESIVMRQANFPQLLDFRRKSVTEFQATEAYSTLCRTRAQCKVTRVSTVKKGVVM